MIMLIVYIIVPLLQRVSGPPLFSPVELFSVTPLQLFHSYVCLPVEPATPYEYPPLFGTERGGKP